MIGANVTIDLGVSTALVSAPALHVVVAVPGLGGGGGGATPPALDTLIQGASGDVDSWGDLPVWGATPDPINLVAGDVVAYDNGTNVALWMAGNSFLAPTRWPPTPGAFWTPIDLIALADLLGQMGGSPQDWTPTIDYNDGDVVRYLGKLWIAKPSNDAARPLAGINAKPGTHAGWDVYPLETAAHNAGASYEILSALLSGSNLGPDFAQWAESKPPGWTADEDQPFSVIRSVNGSIMGYSVFSARRSDFVLNDHWPPVEGEFYRQLDLLGLSKRIDAIPAAPAAQVDTFVGVGVGVTAQDVFTWTKPEGAKSVHVFLVGAGGGGGAGCVDATGLIRCGGGGGGSGASSTFTFPADNLPATMTVKVGRGGTAAPPNGTASSAGLAGSNGGHSEVSNPSPVDRILYAEGGGGGGGGGLATAGAAGFGGRTGTASGISGAASSAAGGAGGVFTKNGDQFASAGGASGGGLVQTGVPTNGGYGHWSPPWGGAQTAAGVAPGGSGADAQNYGGGVFSSGSGGGASNVGGTGGKGGNGGLYGGGGGGGGASENGYAAGGGGNGGVGIAIITTYF